MIAINDLKESANLIDLEMGSKVLDEDYKVSLEFVLEDIDKVMNEYQQIMKICQRVIQHHENKLLRAEDKREKLKLKTEILLFQTKFKQARDSAKAYSALKRDLTKLYGKKKKR